MKNKRCVRTLYLLLLVVSVVVFVMGLSACDEDVPSGDNNAPTTHVHKTASGKGEVTASTCTTEGYKTCICDSCGESYRTNIVKAKGHRYDKAGVCMVCKTKIYTRVDASGAEDLNGEFILFGTYPQTEITDAELAESLTFLAGDLPTKKDAGEWLSYQYRSGGVVNDFMWYCDVVEGGEKYRGVYFTSYRPMWGSNFGLEEDACQDDNGYEAEAVYWFRYEPIKWRIVEEENGVVTLLSELLIDSGEYYHEYSDNRVEDVKTESGSTKKIIYPNNYARSNIRAWLTEQFYHAAFNTGEKQVMMENTVDNSRESAGGASDVFACENTKDYVYLLGYREAMSIVVGEDFSIKQSTDYAKCQGVYVCKNDGVEVGGVWWLRSPDGNDSTDVHFVNFDGNIADHYVDSTYRGICPVVRIALESTES